MLPQSLIKKGSFTSDASVARKIVQVSDEPDYIFVRNRTAWGDDAAETSVQSEWFRGMAQGAAQTMDQAVTTGALSTEAVTTNGFRVYNTATPPQYAALETTAITAANPAVVSMADTGNIEVGDVVRMTETTGMLQIAGYDFEVTAVVANTSITLNFDGQNEAAAATAGNVRLFIPNAMYPRWRYIVPLSGAAGITQATSAVVSTSVAHDFTVGEEVSLRVPSAYGMSEANNQKATVTAVGTYTVTLDLDTSAYTAFVMPDSATAAAGVSPAVIVPSGSRPTPNANPPGVSVDPAFDNRNQWQIEMGSNVITSTSATYDYWVYKADDYSAE